MATTKTVQGKATKTMEHAADTLEQMTAGSQEKLREGVDRTLAAMSEMGSMSKENMEAWIASATAAQKGIEQISTRAVAYSKSAMEQHLAASKAMMTSKSVQELVERQSDYARQAFDGYIAELNRMSDLMSGVAKDAIKPLNERMSAMSHMVQTGIRNGAAR